MPTPLTREDLFEHHVKRIFQKLRETHKDYEADEPFDEDWLNKNRREVANAFLDDVQSWMGIDEAIAESEDEE